jgi:hypothetical protein
MGYRNPKNVRDGRIDPSWLGASESNDLARRFDRYILRKTCRMNSILIAGMQLPCDPRISRWKNEFGKKRFPEEILEKPSHVA